MRVRTVAQVLEHVRCIRKRRLPEPGSALAPHLGESSRVAVHPNGHEVTADSSNGPTALRYTRRCVVGTTGAEMG